jgi:fatty acid desaturase
MHVRKCQYMRVHVCVCVVSSQGQPQLQCLETFAGARSICRGFDRLGFRSKSFEILDRDTTENWCGRVGFLHLLAALLMMQLGGLLWMAPVCTTWVWLSRATYGRHFTDAEGWTRIPKVQAANCMLSRRKHVASEGRGELQRCRLPVLVESGRWL